MNSKPQHISWPRRRGGLSLVELLIVAAVLGILAAIVLPSFRNYASMAKESNAKDNLRILRDTIARYASKHNDIGPGYPNDDTSRTPSFRMLFRSLIQTERYLSDIPTNPFNQLSIVKVLGNSEDFPDAPVQSDTYGWLYKPATKTIKLNQPGTDSEGENYYDY